MLTGRGFLVKRELGLASVDHRPGYRFLVHEKKGMLFETLLVIAPETFAAPLRASE